MSDDALFPGFLQGTFETGGGARIFFRHGGVGPPLLLLHGWPQTHAMWHKVVPAFTRHFHVVLSDLRGYGDSWGPTPLADGSNYTFREMARDQVELMQALGHARFMAAGHDRGARTLHRLLLDHPDVVSRAALLDILPGRDQWAAMTGAGARRAWHRILLAQPHDLPERLLSSVPKAWLLERLLLRAPDERTIFSDRAWAEYVRCLTPKTIEAFCADYRAFAELDLVLDADDEDHLIECPLLLIYGERSYGGSDAPGIWGRRASALQTTMIAGVGHFLAEEAPDAVASRLNEFFCKAIHG